MKAIRSNRVASGVFRITRIPKRADACVPHLVRVGYTAAQSSLSLTYDATIVGNLIEIQIVETGIFFWWSRTDMEPIYP